MEAAVWRQIQADSGANQRAACHYACRRIMPQPERSVASNMGYSSFGGWVRCDDTAAPEARNYLAQRASAG